MSGVCFVCLFVFNVKDSLPGKSPIKNESECKMKANSREERLGDL